jgi:predicted nucleic acid-binding protein
MNGGKFIFDTNMLLLYLQGKVHAKDFNFDTDDIGISIITKIEYLVNPQLGAKDMHLFEELESNIKMFFLTQDDEAIFAETIKIRKKYKLKLPGAIIAATALACNATLISADNIFQKYIPLNLS